MSDNYYPEPIWALHLTRDQIEQGDWLTIAPDEIVDYKVNPLADGWKARYVPSAIERIEALGLPRVTSNKTVRNE